MARKKSKRRTVSDRSLAWLALVVSIVSAFFTGYSTFLTDEANDIQEKALNLSELQYEHAVQQDIVNTDNNECSRATRYLDSAQEELGLNVSNSENYRKAFNSFYVDMDCGRTITLLKDEFDDYSETQFDIGAEPVEEVEWAQAYAILASILLIVILGVMFVREWYSQRQ